MSFNYTRTSFKLQQVKSMFEKEQLIVDTSYQRRTVWSDADKCRLIETILLGYIIPELFLWDAETNPDTGLTLTHIVDGQQRVNAIFEFAQNDLLLKKDYFTTDEAKEKYGDKKFNDLSSEEKVLFWKYEISVVQIKDENIDRIKMMFYRLNLTDYDLNDQEKRHGASWGKFADLANEISSIDFWEEYRLFKAHDIRRMKDVEFCASLILLIRKGVIGQTTQKTINDAYIDYSEDYPEYKEDSIFLQKLIKIIDGILNEVNLKFFRRKTQLYTLFSLVKYLCNKNINIDEALIGKIDKFTIDYLGFKNDTHTPITEGTYLDKISTYKLASSEGVNKLRNRNIRLKILKDILEVNS